MMDLKPCLLHFDSEVMRRRGYIAQSIKETTLTIEKSYHRSIQIKWIQYEWVEKLH